MKIIGYAENLKVYYIRYGHEIFIYFRYHKGKIQRSKIRYNEEGQAYFLVSPFLKYYLNEIMRVNL